MNTNDAKRIIINKLYEKTLYNCIDIKKIYEHIWENIIVATKNFHWLVKSSQIFFLSFYRNFPSYRRNIWRKFETFDVTNKNSINQFTNVLSVETFKMYFILKNFKNWHII